MNVTTHTAQAQGSRWLAHSPVRGFVLKAILLMGAVQGVFLLWFIGSDAFTSYLELNAILAGKLLGALGESVWVSGTSIGSHQGKVDVLRGCDGSQVCAFHAISILAFPVAFHRRCVGALCGVALLFVLNIVRISSLYVLFAYFPEEWFTMAHGSLWPMAFILASVVLWVLWARWAMTGLRRP